MACDLTKGRLELCKDAIGGIKAVFFLSEDYVLVESAEDVITDINDGAGTPAAITLYQYDTKDISNLEETINSSRETGTTFWEQVVNLTVKKMDSVTRKQLKIMAYGSPTLIVWDNNNNLLMVGKDRGAEVTGGTVVTGTALGDLSGYTMTLTAREAEPANFLTAPGTDTTATGYPFENMTTVPTLVKGTDPPAV